jgi:hypothetical protein
MPRYTFRWTNPPEAVLRGLCRDLDPRRRSRQDPSSAFGARPTDAFVHTAWASLRDRCLAHYAAAWLPLASTTLTNSGAR